MRMWWPRVSTRKHLKPFKLNTYDALQDSNLHFDIMNIKFYLLSQELDLLLNILTKILF